MVQKSVLTGYDLKNMFAAGADWLEKVVPAINALNVYPVPDGDCGTNMLSTIHASLEEVGKLSDGDFNSMRESMEQEAAAVLAEIDQLERTTSHTYAYPRNEPTDKGARA